MSTKETEEKRSEQEKCENSDSVKSVSFAVLITSAFALVAALAWNTAIQRLITQYFGSQENRGAWASLLYAFVLTIFIMLVLYVVQRVMKAMAKARCAKEAAKTQQKSQFNWKNTFF